MTIERRAVPRTISSNITPVAAIIWHQLGGNRFDAMTGATGKVSSVTSLNFSLPNRFAAGGINKVSIMLQPDDTYTVVFLKIRGAKVETVAHRICVYADQLRAVFTEVTGLDTRLHEGPQGSAS